MPQQAPSREEIIQFYKNKGFTEAQALGIVGNLTQESQLNPNAVNPTSGAYGYAQWLGDRKKKLFATYGEDVTPQEQLEFLNFELETTESRAKKRLKESQSVEQAVWAFNDGFERAGESYGSQANQKRIKYAMGEAYNPGNVNTGGVGWNVNQNSNYDDFYNFMAMQDWNEQNYGSEEDENLADQSEEEVIDNSPEEYNSEDDDPKVIDNNQIGQSIQYRDPLEELRSFLGFDNQEFGKGGKINPPIYVDNRNDPRLQKYQDSLDVYNKTSYDYNRIKNKKLASDGTPINLDSENRQSYEMWKREYNQPTGKFAVFNSGTNQNMIPKEVAHFRGSGWNFLDYIDQALFEKPVQPVVLNQNKSTVNTIKGKVSGEVVPNNVKGSKLIQVRKEIKPENTNFTVPNNGGYSTPEDYVEPAVEQNIPIQQPIVQEQIPVKQDFRQYMQPNGYSRQGQGSERQSESFYDANGKMTGQIIGGQYVPTEYGKFLQSGMTEEEYLKTLTK